MQCARSSTFKPCVEGLEDRALMTAQMTATLSNGLLTIYGTNGPDHIVVQQENYRISIDNLNIDVIGHGLASSVSAAAVSKIEIHGYEGNDSIQLGGGATSGPNALLKPTTIWAGDGNDKIWGIQGNDVVYGDGKNQIWGPGGSHVITPSQAVQHFAATAPLAASTHVGSLVAGAEGVDHPSGSAELSIQNPFAADVSSLIDLINGYRRSKGLAALTIDSRLTAAADYQADYMARTGDYSHVNLDGRTLGDRVLAAGYSFAFVEENIHEYNPAIGRTLGINRVYSIDELAEYYFDGWQVSPDHNANMLSSEVRNIGVGIAEAANGLIYVSAVFGLQ